MSTRGYSLYIEEIKRGSPGCGGVLDVCAPFHLDLSVLGVILISGVFIRSIQKHVLQLEDVSFFLGTFLTYSLSN